MIRLLIILTAPDAMHYSCCGLVCSDIVPCCLRNTGTYRNIISCHRPEHQTWFFIAVRTSDLAMYPLTL